MSEHDDTISLRHQSIVTASDIDRWAQSYESRSLLPQLVRRLILATVADCERIDFPSGEEIQRPGWDGVLKVGQGNPFVPPGISGWEMSTEASPEKKANEDFEKRTQDSQELPPEETTFVFVTPRKWTKKRSWASQKKANSEWKNIRPYDASDLESWLETAPAVDLWLAEHLGKRFQGCADLSLHWVSVQKQTKPSLKPEVFLCSRDEAVKSLQEWMDSEPQSLTILSHSPNEVIDFFAAFVESSDENKKVDIQSRTIIVEERNAWRALASTKNNKGLVLICHPVLRLEPELISCAISHGHRVLLCANPYGINPRGKWVELVRPLQYLLKKALENSGLDSEKSDRLAKDAGGSLTIVKNRLSIVGGTDRPQWSFPEMGPDLIPFLLVGGWDEKNQHDCGILERIGDKTYAELATIARSFQRASEAPLIQTGSGWELTSRIDSWERLSLYLTRSNTRTFKEVATEVLSENDPILEMPMNERWLASCKGIRLRYSTMVRKGLAETLALMGNWIDQLENPAPSALNLPGVVYSTVRELLYDKDLSRWCSLAHLLPILVEASPEMFLDSVEKDLSKPNPVLLGMFQDKDSDPMFTSSPHTGLLWALESLAWNPTYLARVSLILARLAQEDPGGKLGNRPIHCLRSIFLGWCPQTTATVQERINVLKRVAERHEHIGQELLFSLLPKYHDLTMQGYRPQWRSWHLERSATVTSVEYFGFVQNVANILLDHASVDKKSYVSLVDSIDSMPPQFLDGLEKALQQHTRATLGEDVAGKLWEELYALARKHRAHSTAKWALPCEAVDRLESLAAHFAPDEPSVVYKSLFSHNALYEETQVMGGENDNKWQEREKQLSEKRLESLKETLARPDGHEQVQRLALAVDQSWEIGILLGKNNLVPDEYALPNWLLCKEQNLQTLCGGFVAGKFDAEGYKWPDALDKSKWNPDEIGRFYALLAFAPDTWNGIEKLTEAQRKAYWRFVRGFLSDQNPADYERGILLLIENGRADAALDNLGMRAKKALSPSSLFTMALKAYLAQSESDASSVRQLDQHGIQRIFAVLQERNDVDQQELAQLEFAYLPFLDGHGGNPHTLGRLLAENPVLFVDLLKVLYKGDQEEEKSVPQEEIEDLHAKAKNVFLLFRNWKTIPGTRSDGSIDGGYLLTWVQNARRAARECRRLKVCDVHIGELFANAPASPDGMWPCNEVCKVFEQVDSEELENGLHTGIFNQRGFCSKSLYEGGRQERDLAASFREKAKRLETIYPRVAKVLHSLAQSYDQMAIGEDERTRLS